MIDLVPKKTRTHVDDLRGASRLAIEATKSVTDLVQAMHVTIASGPSILGRPLELPARLVTGLVYGSIRGVTQIVGTSIDAALAQLAPLLGESTPSTAHEAVVAALNGVLGDYLAATNNPLAIAMRLRACGRRAVGNPSRCAAEHAFPMAGNRLVILAHGSSMSDQQWCRFGHDHGGALAADLGCTVIYLHYNSGLHISTTGRAFADLLEQLVTEWPWPLESLVLVGHSMGGLVARSACHYGEAAEHRWRRHLRKLVCIGSPHHGAPLERAGNWVDQLLGISAYSAPLTRLAKIRSAGVTDLRFGYVLDEHWEGRDRFALAPDARSKLSLPDGVQCYAIAGTMAIQTARKLTGDGLVPVNSALGKHAERALTLGFPVEHQSIAYATPHLDLLNRREVYETLKSWVAAP